MEKIKHLSIRKTIVLYMVVTLFLSYLLSYFVIHAAARRQLQIWTKYMGEQYWEEIEKYEEGHESIAEDDIPYRSEPPVRPSKMEMSRADWRISELCDFLQTYSILVLSVIGTVAAVFLFYRNKLKVPIEKLTKASVLIGNNDLDFSLEYDRKDEMGQLCEEFEKMRKQLAENNRRMWQMVENEKALRASIAHDIRSPLAVLKGYQEMISEVIEHKIADQIADQKKETWEGMTKTERGEKTEETITQIADMLSEEAAQIKRMEDFLDIMRKLSSLEERKIVPKKETLTALEAKYRRSMEILAKKSGKEYILLAEGEKEVVRIDAEMVTEVVENLFTNALRYAKKKVKVVLSVKETEFWVEIQDDGQGFGEDREILTRAFYHANPQDDLTHFGMGLYLSRIYCEKHGGHLLLGNGEDGGGKAVAVFSLEAV